MLGISRPVLVEPLVVIVVTYRKFASIGSSIPAKSLGITQATNATSDLPYHAVMKDCSTTLVKLVVTTLRQQSTHRVRVKSIHVDFKIAIMDVCHAVIRILRKEDEVSWMYGFNCIQALRAT